jgi:hypothetical protein
MVIIPIMAAAELVLIVAGWFVVGRLRPPARKALR